MHGVFCQQHLRGVRGELIGCVLMLSGHLAPRNAGTLVAALRKAQPCKVVACADLWGLEVLCRLCPGRNKPTICTI